MLSTLLLAHLIACGGSEPAPAPAPAAAPAPAPVAAAPAAPTVGAYIPTELAAKAYEAAKAAGADKVTANPKSGNAEAIAKGKATYAAMCTSCHGATGMGDGVAGASLPQKPSNFRDKARWDFTPFGTKVWILKNGIAGSAMAGLAPDENQAAELLAYIEAEFVGK